MNFLEKKILSDGVVKKGDVLKIDNFLNHQVDIRILRQMAEEFKRRFEGECVNKILTIESSGIAIAAKLADLYDVPMVFAKKGDTVNSTDDRYTSHAYSFTHKKTNSIHVAKNYLTSEDRILIIDDFLADGQAMKALIDISNQAGAKIVGLGVAVEKGHQPGGRELRRQGYHLESIAIIEEMDTDSQTIKFRQ